MMVRVKGKGRRRTRYQHVGFRIFVCMLLLLCWAIFKWSGSELNSSLFQCSDVSLPSISDTKLCQISLNPSTHHEIPKTLCQTHPDLAILFAPQNTFTEVPASLGACPNLQMVSFKSNRIKRIDTAALTSQLRWLILTDNQLTQIPAAISQTGISLQKLMLSGNQLGSLPVEMSILTNLELVRLSSNKLKTPPMEVLQLPNLAWIALSGNPFLAEVNAKLAEETSLKVLNDPILETVGTVLGQGTSGVARKVESWNGQTVAVKSYKSTTMTSDGSPLQERQINSVVASIHHESLVKIHGQTPNGSLVMEFLEGYVPFGLPPSMDTCTRDVYPENQSVTTQQAILMVTNLLQVFVQLHAKGICHGDFYGHNILVKENAVKLSDFGASFFYDTTKPYGRLIEKIEMRAFGHFVQEVNMLVGRRRQQDPSDALMTVQTTLENLYAHCFEMNSFQELNQLWASLHH